MALSSLTTLWQDEYVRTIVKRGNEVALPEKCVQNPLVRALTHYITELSLDYFFAQLHRLFDLGYRPNDQDILRCRSRTIGITETAFHLNSHELVVVDVGGQKAERRKWIHCFQDVASILFVVSLSGYDQCLVEDRHAVSLHVGS